MSFRLKPKHKAGVMIAMTTIAMLPFQNCTQQAFQVDQALTSKWNNQSSGLDVLDTMAPVVTIISPASGASSKSPLLVSGTCEAGSSVALTIGNSSPQNMQCLNGAFAGTLSLTQADGGLTLRATQTDAAGNTGSRQVSFVKDTVAPNPQFISPAANARLTAQSLSLTGSCETGLSVNISGSALSAPSQATCVNSAFAMNVSLVNVNATASLSLEQTDAAGNIGTASRSIIVDLPVGAPAVMITSPAANLLTRTGITLSGTCVTGLPVNISGSGINAGSTVSCLSGAFTSAITFSNGDGIKNVIVAQTNAQNATGQDSRSFNFDATAPIVQITSPAAGTSATNSINLAGVCESGLSVTVNGTGVASQMSLPCNTSMFQASVPLSANTGVKTIMVTQMDAAGNVGSNTRAFERTAAVTPTVSITAPVNGATVSGSVSITASVSDTTAVSAVQFSIDGGAYGADDVSQPYSTSLDTTTLTNGVHKILARVRDTAGGMNISAEVTINVNNTVSVGGCAPYPAFPDANCTGWQHTGVTLKTVPGQVTSGPGWNWEGAPFNYLKITGANAVLDGLDVQGCVYVDVGVTSATIKRSRISGSCNYLFRRASDTAAISLTDVELVGSAVQMGGANYKWLRVNARAFTGKAAMTGSNTTIEDSYIHDQVCNLPDHQSGIGTNGSASNIIMRHNHVDMSPTGCVSGGISNYDDFGAFHNILIEKNLINSGGFGLKAGFEDNNAAGNSEMKVIDNIFGRKYFPNCGSFGVVSNWISGVGNVWSGNTWGGGAAANGSHNTGDPANP